MQNRVIVLAFFALTSSCGSKPTSTVAVPSWVRQSPRTFSDGRITYVESDDDMDADRARAKAEGLALQDLANECTLAPKGARIEDRFETKTAHLFQAHVKVVVTVEQCDEAKRASSSETIRAIADASLHTTIKTFQDIYGEPDLASSISAVKMHVKDDSSFGSNLSTARPSTMPPPSDIDDIRAYFFERQRIARAKQAVVLAAPNAYVVGPLKPTRLSVQLAKDLSRGARVTQAFESLHPDLKSWAVSWSRYRRELMRPRNDR